ncbi:LacI family DNA-binding transcriptional regulator [Zobellia galactanivorans]|uniref:LacI-type transcriptional regulator n=1 Tax=Zobellia galactanivorans (strain DSM 12802 / CCUG 47099 / CIP 106680 / NCIMB 13871 / Dsij) TaxID=63186 RepID=G0L2B9_ZOBGA|nr:LacI family DNA-binding transcriptional regulator [Zobellia galactanivorans]CAZ98035.1 LacI-type transcriptional regulator [Zobellia galactanivorans]
MSKITLKKIATHFNVSISTVSKAINDSYEISEQLRTKIQDYAKANNYRPNKVALNLLNRNTKTIGIVIPNILNYFFVQVLYGIESVADIKGYSIITCITNQSLEKETKTLELLSAGSVDGIIISSAADESELPGHVPQIKKLHDNQIPMVMFDRVTDLIQCDKVIVDDYEAGYKATRFFINTGCRTIAVVTPIEDSNISKLRIDGYKKALDEMGVDFDEKLIVPIGKEDDLDITMSFLLNYRPIDAIMTLDEITAVKVMSIVQSRGYRVPEDISIIGFTNGELSKYVTPSLTMVSQHGKYIGETTVDILIDRIENKDSKKEFETKVVKTSLIVRNSTKKPL